jgi:hypothetical protein
MAGIAQDKPKSGLGKIIGKADTLIKSVNEKPNSLTTPPINLTPKEGQVINEKDGMFRIDFSWTPASPLPNQGAHYVVRVFEVKSGQAPADASKKNRPLLNQMIDKGTVFAFESDVAKKWPIAQGSKYGWEVGLLDENQMIVARSVPTTFTIGNGQAATMLKANCLMELTLVNTECISTNATSRTIRVKFKVQNQSTPIAPATLYWNHTNTITHPLFTSYSLNSSNLVQAKNDNFVASVGVNSVVATNPTTYPGTIAQGNSVLQEVDVNINNSISSFSLLVLGTSKGNQPGDALVPCYDDILIDSIPSCRCTTCDQAQWTWPDKTKYDTSVFRGTNNIMTLYGNISFGSQKIVKLSTEIVDFYWYTEGDCKKCNTNDYYYGNLVSGSITGLTATSVADENGIPLQSSHQLDFVSPTLNGVTLNNPIALNISLPPQTQLSCCTDCFRFCIRYTATFMENGVCKTCSIVKCYESKRKHRKVGAIQWPQPNQCGDIVFPPNGGNRVLNNQIKKN